MPITGPIEVRPLTPDEWGVFRDVRLAALRDAPDAFGSTLESEVGLSEERWRFRVSRRNQFIAIVGGAVVGTVGGIGSDEGPFAELISMWVDPVARGRGVGDRLVEAVLGWARGTGFGEVRLWVAVGNLPAERLYARHGFSRTGAEKPIRPGEPRVEFEMLLGV